MGWISILICTLIAGAILTGVPRLPSSQLRLAAAIVSLIVFLSGVLLSSIRYVPSDRLGVVIKNALGPKLPPGKIIATDGEMGPQARILPPGWHVGLWPVIFDIQTYPVTVIEAGQVGLLKASDGKPLPEGQIYAPEWGDAAQQAMLDAQQFLTTGGGFKGPQSSVLTPGTYRLNPLLFEVEMVAATNIPPASVGVVKANVGLEPTEIREGHGLLVDKGVRGVWRTPLPPQQYYLHTKAFEVTVISTKAHIVEYTSEMRDTKDTKRSPQKDATQAVQQGQHGGADFGEREIQVRSADGFTFPVDVRVEYVIDDEKAPLVVATLRDDQESLQRVLNSAVRAIFRNSAEHVKALDYVRERSRQESQALESLSREMAKYGVRVTAVRIGNIGDEQSLGVLLKTQTDRELAQQEQVTFQEQQKAAEQKKALTRTQQEAEEEKRLATANYQVKIAEQDKQRRIIEAGAEAEAIRIKAEAQAQAFASIAKQIGAGNSALLEMLKVIGERQIEITPRVMVSGQNGPGEQSPETVALIGTMLESMMKQPQEPARVAPAAAKPE